jgi:uncharacterized membrane protein
MSVESQPLDQNATTVVAEPATDMGKAPYGRDAVRPQISEPVESAIGWSLRIGVAISMVLVLAGAAVAFIGGAYGGGDGRRHALTSVHTVVPHTLSAAFTGAAHGHGPALIALGCLVLILTPIIRVVVSVLGFALVKDRVYALITLLVLALLGGSLLVSTL